MSIKKCEGCGLAIKTGIELVECFKYGNIIPDENKEEACSYYIEIKYEDGEAMTPLQHFLLKDQELKARKMKGVI